MLILNRKAKVACYCTKHLIVWVHKCANCVQTKKYARTQCTIPRLKMIQEIQRGTMDISRHIGDKAEAMSQTSHNRMAVQGDNNAQLGCKCHRVVHVFALNTTICCYQTVITDCGSLIQTAIRLNQALMLKGAFGSCHLRLICWSCRRDALKKAERRRGC